MGIEMQIKIMFVLVALTTLVIPVLAEDNFRNNVSANGFYIQDTAVLKTTNLVLSNGLITV
jgi:hypothetical protein